MITQEQGQHIRKIRLEIVTSLESHDKETARDLSEELADYMKQHEITGSQYAQWNRANPVRRAKSIKAKDFTMSLAEAFKEAKK